MADATTLDDLMRMRAEDLSKNDLEAIVAGLREQRDRWTLNQAQGSRKVVKSKAIPIAIDLVPQKIVL